MFNSLMMLAVEANGVVALRMMKLMRGGRSARREAKLMVSEKMDAAFEATARLMVGASGDEIVQRYRQHVAANPKRLGRLNSGRPKTTPMEVAASEHVAGTCNCTGNELRCLKKPQSMMIFVEVSATRKYRTLRALNATGIGPPRACR